MNLSNHSKYSLIMLLVLLNFIIRIPSIPHEMGNDGVTIHILANSISAFGYANYWAHPSSIFGFYPYSYASAVPFALSGISQCTGAEMEVVIWMFCVIIGLFSAFTAYLVAGAIWDNDVFKFLVAFTYSLSPGILAFSTWDVTTRGLFIVLLPLFIYLLLKVRISAKYGILALILSILLMATHHYFYLTIPIVFSLVILTILYKFKKIIKFKNTDNFVNIAFVIGLLGMFMIPFFTGIFVEWGRYDELHWMFEYNVRYTGILVFFSIGGLAYLSFKPNKRFEEWFFLLTCLSLTIFLYVQTYVHYFIIIFTCILIGVALTNIARVEKQKRKYASTITIIVLLLSVGFSGFYQHWRTDIRGTGSGEWYMDKETHIGALWIKNNINQNKKLVGFDELTGRRIFAISEVPTLVGMAPDCMLSYGFIDMDNVNISKNSPLSMEFYIGNPYKLNSAARYPEEDYYHLRNAKFDGWLGKPIINRYNLSYAIENRDAGENTFIRSLRTARDNVYDNGKIRVWNLGRWEVTESPNNMSI